MENILAFFAASKAGNELIVATDGCLQASNNSATYFLLIPWTNSQSKHLTN
jgi:hypothetical protein